MAGHDVLRSLAMVGQRRGSAGLACFEQRSCGSLAIWFGGSMAMRVWARISGNGRSSMVVAEEFLTGRVSAWTPMTG
ncbi:hypothetical protein FH972_018239 [Carpinus fangiana]|uniref:Uncharacterized protein n=1 Tax=Carpinus fangiana TaxID=176857 RepID=A0A5N6RLD9_9ROSI|nr:hypothetical protein FH972_018239 [Carpinus fangiana]